MASVAPVTTSAANPGAGAALIAGQFGIEFTRPLDSGGGLPTFAAFAASGARTASHLMAVQVQRGWAARHRALQALVSLQSVANDGGPLITGVLLPLAHGPATLPDGAQGYFIICPAPNGRALIHQATPWSETELVDRLLRPAAAALAGLAQRGVTHRSIRADNVFLSPGGDTCTLGCAWAAPAAAHQPPASEPPYSAMCDPGASGEGTIADDIYALGALMIRLALGTDPLADLPPDLVIARKLDSGSFSALTADRRLPTGLADLVRGMVADDPEHRPAVTLLSDTVAMRARRIASRPARRASRPMEAAGIMVHTPRALAFVLARHGPVCLPLLRSGVITMWLRRIVGDPATAGRIGESIAHANAVHAGEEKQADLALLMSAVALLDPLAPMLWGDAVLWPDGFGEPDIWRGTDTQTTQDTSDIPDTVQVVQEVRPSRASGI